MKTSGRRPAEEAGQATDNCATHRVRAETGYPESRAAVEYAGTRVQFGRPIGQNQGVAFFLADVDALVDAVRL